ncbi:nucleoside hydrolase [Plastorhodobacter daqingensis]|uniref:Nucleoside hydrolase n=1 Tax=Plastorhodobacter daqingensis TaxID=1387281 RepID=A0ABW2UMT3_9RHOB
MGTVWIDSDMGFDDLAAVAMVVASGRAVAGLSLVAGNSPLPRVIANARAAAALFGWDFPLYGGACRPLIGPLITADYVLGDTGMPGGTALPDAPPGPDLPRMLPALIRFADNGGRDLLALGPLTNIAAFALARPDLARGMRLIWMGGAPGRGNHSAAAEFNAFVDPEAVQLVIDAGVTIRMVGLDPCRQVTVGLADAQALAARPGPHAPLLAGLLDGYCRIAADGQRPMALYDPVAAAALIAPDSVTFAPARLDCETTGRLTRGMTVIEWRAHKAAPNAQIATAADAPRIRALFMAGLAHAATGAAPAQKGPPA